MQSLGLGAAGDRIVFDAARSISGRFKVTLNVADDGTVHLKGATDTRGHVTKKDRKLGERIIPKGTKIRGRTIDPLAAAWGFTKEDVRNVRAQLANAGIKRSTDQTFALLCSARFVLDGGTLPPAKRSNMSAEDRRAYEREKKRRRRAALRERGQCIVCGIHPVVYDERRGCHGSTCYWCGREANQRKRTKTA